MRTRTNFDRENKFGERKMQMRVLKDKAMNRSIKLHNSANKQLCKHDTKEIAYRLCHYVSQHLRCCDTVHKKYKYLMFEN